MSETQDRETRTAAKARTAIANREREGRVVELRLRGWSFDRIAIAEGYANRGGAQKAWERAVQRIPARPAAEARDLAIERAQTMVDQWLARARPGDIEADRRLLAWEERLAKLQGLDAPTKVQVQRSEVDEEIERLSADLDAAARAAATRERSST